MLYYYIVFSFVLTTMSLMLFFGVIIYTVVKETYNCVKWKNISKRIRRNKK